MVTSFVSAPPAPEPPAPEPPPASTRVNVQTLSSAKEMTSSAGGSPRSSPGPEGTTALRQGPPQKPYTFLEEKARQAEWGRDEGRRREWVEHRGHGNAEKKPDCPPSLVEVLRAGSSALLSSDFLWATHCAKLCGHRITISLHHLERKPLHYYHHPFHRGGN